MNREAASHADRQHRLIHSLELRVKELERDCVQLLYERDAAIAEREHARDLACQLEADLHRAKTEWTMVVNA